jgi:hypothetical protein
MDRKLIDQYEADGQKVSLAIRGLTREDLLCRPAADANVGKWSIQEVVVHLHDAEVAFADRIRRVIAEDEPKLMAWDENKFASRLHYEEQSAEDAATVIELTRKNLARVLRKLPENAFQRAGMHSEAGRQTVLDILAKAVWHLDHHLKFIKSKKELMGKEMW